MKDNPWTIEARRRKVRDKQYQEYINEVAREANSIQELQPDLSRTEALRVAEIVVSRRMSP